MASWDEKKEMEALRKAMLEDLKFDEVMKTFEQIGGVDPGRETEKYDKKKKKKGGSVSRTKGGTMTKAQKETIRRNRQSILKSHRAKEKSTAGRRRLSNLLGENTGMGFTPKTIRPKKKRGGTVSRKSGGKIMQGYKAGGKV